MFTSKERKTEYKWGESDAILQENLNEMVKMQETAGCRRPEEHQGRKHGCTSKHKLHGQQMDHAFDMEHVIQFAENI